VRVVVGKLVLGRRCAVEAGAAADRIGADLSTNKRIARYVSPQGIKGHVQKVYAELTGAPPPPRRQGDEAKLRHAREHGLSLA
jgi:hypothetical protein